MGHEDSLSGRPSRRGPRAGAPDPRRDLLATLLFDGPPQSDRLMLRLREMRALEGLDVCATALEMLTDLEREEAEAERLLTELLDHREALAGSLGRDPGFTVAALDYLTNRRPTLRNPVVRDLARVATGARRALEDPLTQLESRRCLEDALAVEVRRGQRHAREFALLLLDLDTFRSVNEVHGRAVGDRVLHQAGRLIRRTVRESDRVSRHGGEEFLVLLAEVDRCGAHDAGERVRRTVEERFSEAQIAGRMVTLTLSAGVACFPADGASGAHLVASAAQALGLAKAGGRNRVVAHRAERRADMRYPVRGAATLTLTRSDGERRPARLLDVSRRGAGIEGPEPMGKMGDPVVLAFEEGPAGPALRGRVVRLEPGSTPGLRQVAVTLDPAISESRLGRLAVRGRGRAVLSSALP